MKKYVLLFGIFCLGLINYSFADTVGNLTSDSEICSVNFENTDYISVNDLSCGNGDRMYYCVSTNDNPFYISLFYRETYVYDSLVCFNVPFIIEDTNVYFYSDLDFTTSINVSGTLYISSNPILINSSCDCPVCESTFSTLFVNGTQITGSSNVYISTPDHFEYEISYYTGYMDLNIINVGDPEYIENILAIQTYSPTSDEFALSFVGGLTLILPYILIVLFIIFIVKIIRKIFK